MFKNKTLLEKIILAIEIAFVLVLGLLVCSKWIIPYCAGNPTLLKNIIEVIGWIILFVSVLAIAVYWDKTHKIISTILIIFFCICGYLHFDNMSTFSIIYKFMFFVCLCLIPICLFNSSNTLLTAMTSMIIIVCCLCCQVEYVDSIEYNNEIPTLLEEVNGLISKYSTDDHWCAENVSHKKSSETAQFDIKINNVKTENNVEYYNLSFVPNQSKDDTIPTFSKTMSKEEREQFIGEANTAVSGKVYLLELEIPYKSILEFLHFDCSCDKDPQLRSWTKIYRLKLYRYSFLGQGDWTESEIQEIKKEFALIMKQFLNEKASKLDLLTNFMHEQNSSHFVAETINVDILSLKSPVLKQKYRYMLKKSFEEIGMTFYNHNCIDYWETSK